MDLLFGDEFLFAFGLRITAYGPQEERYSRDGHSPYRHPFATHPFLLHKVSYLSTLSAFRFHPFAISMLFFHFDFLFLIYLIFHFLPCYMAYGYMALSFAFSLFSPFHFAALPIPITLFSFLTPFHCFTFSLFYFLTFTFSLLYFLTVLLSHSFTVSLPF